MVLLQVRNDKTSKISQQLTKLWNKLCYLSSLRLTEASSNFNSNFNSSSNNMALPQGAFITCKIRQQFQENDLIVSRMRSAIGAEKADNIQREYLPVKYNDKLMNSIWGLYNRYSPHNVKKNEFAPPKF